jgi:hypothetical protein
MVLFDDGDGLGHQLVPLMVDGVIYASSMVMLDSARRKVPRYQRWPGGCWAWASGATLAANVAHGLGHGLIGAAVAAWPTAQRWWGPMSC